VTPVIADNMLKLTVPLSSRDWRCCLCLLRRWSEAANRASHPGLEKEDSRKK